LTRQLYKEALVYCRNYIKENPYEDLSKIHQLVDKIADSARKISDETTQLSTHDNKPRNKITLDEIIGHDEAKREIKENLINPALTPEINEKFNITRGKGILMYGPPGTGKTTFAKAVASEINAKFRHVQSNEILDKYVGESEKKVKEIFDEANKELTIVLFDEFDQLTRTDQSTDVSKRIIALLKELIDGYGANDNVFILAATNYPWDIEFGIMRRLFPVYLGLPTQSEIVDLLMLKVKGMPISEDIDFTEIAQQLVGYSGSDVANIVNRAARNAANREREKKIENAQYSTVINEFDLLDAINKIPKSVSSMDLIRYEEYKKQYNERG